MEEGSPGSIRLAFADSIAFLNGEDWDHVCKDAGLFLSRRFLRVLEENLPENLVPHYALAYRGGRPVAAVVAQSLEIQVADLSSRRSEANSPGLLKAVEKAVERSLLRAGKSILLFDAHLTWSGLGETAPAEEEPALWPEVISRLWAQWRSLLQAAERAAELPVGWIHQRLLVCGNLLTTGPHGVAFAPGENAAELWPAVEEAIYRIRRSMKIFGDSDLVMIKDLTDEQADAAAALKEYHFRRFETEPNMVLHFKPGWRTFEDCLKEMKSEYRSRIKKTMREVADAGIVLERVGADRVRAMAGEIYGLYLQVHEQQKLRLVTVSPGWIPALAEAFGEDFRTVIASPSGGGSPLGFITVIRDGSSAYGYYIGFDKAAASREVPIYLGLMYEGVSQGIQMGADRIYLGRTALAPKAQIGAKAQPMCGYLRHRLQALNLAVPTVLALLPDPDQPPERHPFKGS